ncbi:hypothetical protein ACWCQZ_24075 [Streptomyces sp. NPDC002285]|uniref:hypothetical protein n=1 Tax=Streptomyces sp. NPDC056468 TaxID=3345830 RepID=UPI0036C46655
MDPGAAKGLGFDPLGGTAGFGPVDGFTHDGGVGMPEDGMDVTVCWSCTDGAGQVSGSFEATV